MLIPSFTPRLPPGWSYAIIRVTSLDHGHLVIYATWRDTFKEQRVAFVKDGFVEWDHITWTEFLGTPKIKRVRFVPKKIERVRWPGIRVRWVKR